MTDQDKIELPPLPSFAIAPIADERTVRDYAIAAVLADRERRADPAQPAKPKVHSVAMKLQSDGCAWRATEKACWTTSMVAATVTLCWTDDGRAWIESEKNRELAQQLRYWTIDNKFTALDKAADALDGGVR